MDNYMTLEITTTQQCNMNCSYCFEHKSDAKKDTSTLDPKLIVIKIEELLNSELFKRKFDGLTLSFWGGEPTLNDELIEYVCQQTINMQNIKYFIYTNGYNIENFLNILNKYFTKKEDKKRFRIQISYDGKAIHDTERLDHFGNTTTQLVINNATRLKKLDYNVSFKSTIPLNKITHMYDCWTDFKNLHPIFGCNYSPTFDYHDVVGDLNMILESLKTQLIRIAIDEESFYNKYSKYLLSWFQSGAKRMCCAGESLYAIDGNNDMYVCHGSLYSLNKKDFIITNLKDKTFISDIINYSFRIKELNKKTEKSDIDMCAECVAVNCQSCNITKYDNSTLKTFDMRYGDRSSMPYTCEIFKLLGVITRALYKRRI